MSYPETYDPPLSYECPECGAVISVSQRGGETIPQLCDVLGRAGCSKSGKLLTVVDGELVEATQ